jgi:hypothetical protein
MAGYSGTPLVRKLGIKGGTTLLVVNAPADYPDLVAPLPDGARLLARAGRDTDAVHVFSTARADLARRLRALLPKLRQDGMIWVSWPKRASKVPTDITEDVIREVALPMGLVDVKVCAVNEVWSGLKLVIRKELRKGKGGGPGARR